MKPDCCSSSGDPVRCRLQLTILTVFIGLIFMLHSAGAADQAAANEATNLWKLAREASSTHRFSTLLTAQDVRDRLSRPEGLQRAIDWCKQTAVTKVYIESFRDGYQAERTALETARDRFRAEHFEVSGCVTPTKVGKPSTGWNLISCYTDLPTQQNVKDIFEYAAGMFDEIMIDDFWFTDCTCAQCDAARKARLATVEEKRYPVNTDSWEDYHSDLMVQVSRDLVLGAAKRVNPKATLIIKYPQWYDRFHERGYEVLRETADFDRIWVGTETRNYTDQRWGGTPQYEAYFIMRWLGGVGGAKCGGGWYDPFGTTEATYLEQARQTVLGGARESMLFCYGALQRDTGPKNIQALRANIPELLSVAKEISKRHPIGIAAYKPANSHPKKEERVFDFVGMLGLPLVPCHEFPENAPAAFFSIHSLKDAAITNRLDQFIKSGKPTLVTDGLAQALSNRVDLSRANVRILAVKQDPKGLLSLTQSELDPLRALMLARTKTTFKAPNRVGFYLFDDSSWVVENFNDEAVSVELNGKPLEVPGRSWVYRFE